MDKRLESLRCCWDLLSEGLMGKFTPSSFSLIGSSDKLVEYSSEVDGLPYVFTFELSDDGKSINGERYSQWELTFYVSGGELDSDGYPSYVNMTGGYSVMGVMATAVYIIKDFVDGLFESGDFDLVKLFFSGTGVKKSDRSGHRQSVYNRVLNRVLDSSLFSDYSVSHYSFGGGSAVSGKVVFGGELGKSWEVCPLFGGQAFLF
jgi:hypothetical protein